MPPKTRLLTLTNGVLSKPVKVQVDTCTLDKIRKEAKNKFRQKFQHVVYRGERDQEIKTNEELQVVLNHHQRESITLFFTNTAAPANNNNSENDNEALFVISRTKQGLSYIVAKGDMMMEEAAISQLKHASELEGCMFCIGMPDLHPGKGIPIGAVVMTEERIAYPQLVDNDIGCGMSFVETHLNPHKLNMNKLQRLADSLQSIDSPFASPKDVMELCSQPLQWGSNNTTTLEPLPELPEIYHYNNLGTIGGGNHFAELQAFDDVLDADAIRAHGIDTDKVHLLVHSGSRSLGSAYLRDFCEQAATEKEASKRDRQSGHIGVATDSKLFQTYLSNHQVALNYAARNRQLIARRLLSQMGGAPPSSTETNNSDALKCHIDINHNYLEKTTVSSLDAMAKMADQGLFPKTIAPLNDTAASSSSTCGWIHRKGATPTNQSKILVIPGSRGSRSYLVEVNDSAAHGSGYSLAHGAGRCLKRSTALAKHKHQYPNAKQLLQTNMGSVVVCDKKDLIYEEAPASYKDVDDVVKCLSEGIQDEHGRGIVRILATLRPLLTYKYKDPYRG